MSVQLAVFFSKEDKTPAGKVCAERKKERLFFLCSYYLRDILYLLLHGKTGPWKKHLSPITVKTIVKNNISVSPSGLFPQLFLSIFSSRVIRMPKCLI